MNVRHAGGTVEIDITRQTEIVALDDGRSLAARAGRRRARARGSPCDGGAMAVAVIAETNGVKPPM